MSEDLKQRENIYFPTQILCKNFKSRSIIVFHSKTNKFPLTQKYHFLILMNSIFNFWYFFHFHRTSDVKHNAPTPYKLLTQQHHSAAGTSQRSIFSRFSPEILVLGIAGLCQKQDNDEKLCRRNFLIKLEENYLLKNGWKMLPLRFY